MAKTQAFVGWPVAREAWGGQKGHILLDFKKEKQIKKVFFAEFGKRNDFQGKLSIFLRKSNEKKQEKTCLLMCKFSFFFPDLQKSLIFKIYTQLVQSIFIQFSKVESLKKNKPINYCVWLKVQVLTTSCNFF